MTTRLDKIVSQLVMLPSVCMKSPFYNFPSSIQYCEQNIQCKCTATSSTHCFVFIKSILLVEDEQDLLASAGDRLFTSIFQVSCRKRVYSFGHQSSLTSYCYIPAAWPPLSFLIFLPIVHQAN